MPLVDRSLLRTFEVALASAVLVIAVLTFTSLPTPYPTWPTVRGIPVDPELVVPGLLGLVTLVGALLDGLDAGSILVGMFGVVTLVLAVASIYSLYAVAAGGVFWGGFFTLVAAIPLAVTVVTRSAVRRSGLDEVPFAG